MTSRIPFPATPENGDFHTEPNGMRWQWSSFKHRWSFKPPAAITSGYQISLTPPTDTTLLWVDPSDGSVSYYDTENEVWVVGSGAGTDGEDGQDGQDLTTTAEVVTIPAAEHLITTVNVDKYLRFTSASAKTVKIPVLSIPVGSLLTVRNVGSGDLTLQSEPPLAITLNAFSGGLVLATNTSAQLIYVGANEWDLL
jgi:hypothetical protein